MNSFKIKHGGYSETAWSGGTTTQLWIWPEDAEYAKRNFTWRVSTARVECEESDFTHLPGVERCLMILDGSVTLSHEGHYEKELRRYDQDNFSGDWHTKSRGRARDFNLMTTSGEGRVQVVEIDGETETVLSLKPVAESWREVSELLYVTDGELIIKMPDGISEELNCGDTVMFHSDSRRDNPKVVLRNSSCKKVHIIRTVIYHN